jgi:hypothetical protein
MTMVTRPVASVRDVLYDGNATDQIARSMRDHQLSSGVRPALSRLAPRVIDEIDRRIAVHVSALAEISIGEVALNGLRSHAAIPDAIRRSEQCPATPVIATLARHRIAVTYQPRIDVLLEDQPVWTIDIELALVLTVESAVAAIRAGRLASVTLGDCDCAATLGVNNVELAHGEARLPTGMQL